MIFQELKSHKCLKDEWANVLKILEETKLSIWLSGKENFEDFYVVNFPDSKEVVCCFTFSQNADVGILKNFAVPKKYQGKGIATHIANNEILKVAKEKGIKKLYLHGNDRGPYTSIHFWKKTIYKHIMSSEVKDQFYIDYFDYLINNYSDDVLFKEAIFYLDIEKHFEELEKLSAKIS